MANRTVLIDTSVIIDFLRKDRKEKTLLWQLLEQNTGKISAVTLFELLAGAKTEKHRYDVELLTRHLAVLPFDNKTADNAATIFQELKSKNRLVEFRDIFIAATALEHNLPLATLNKKHFENISTIELLQI
jgi:predicted nucleic acid-binding protein